MKRRTIIAFAIVGAVLTATAPVAAQHDGLVVGSQHTTFGTGDGEPSPTTMDGVVVSESGTSATVTMVPKTIDNFDDGNLDGWGGDTSSYDASTSRVHNGTHSMEFNGVGSTQIVTKDFTGAQYQNLSFWVNKDTEGNGSFPRPQIAYRSASGGIGPKVGISNGNVGPAGNIAFDNGTDIVDTGISTSLDTWYQIKLVNIDYDAQTFDIVVINESGAVIGSYTGATYEEQVDNMGKVRVVGNGDKFWVDSLKTGSSGPPATYVSATHNVTNAELGSANLTLDNTTATVKWKGYDGSQWQVVNSSQYSSSGNKTLDISGTNYDSWRVNVTFKKTGANPVGQLHDEGILFTPQSPNITSASPEPGGEVNESQVTLSADVEDPDFGTAQGDTVTADFYLDGQQVDTQTISSNGTVSTTVEPSTGGTHNWSVQLADSYGESESLATREFQVPSTLRVFYETEPETLVKEENLTLTMQFFPLDDGDIESREVADGTVDLTGLPVDERFVVTVKANESGKFVYRRIVLDSIYDSERIFLLRENQSYSNIVFELQDPTGQFPPDETELFVEKPITINGSTDYYTIAGDTFGASGRFPAALMNDERYRLRVSGDGSERILGAYTATGDELVPLQIQRIEPSADEKNAGSVYGSLTQNANSSSLAVRFRSGQPGTEVTYNVTDSDGNVVVPETTAVGTDFAHVYEFDASGTQSYNVSYEVVYPDGTTQTGYFIAGAIGGIGDRFNMDPQVLSIMSWGAILASMGLIVIVDRKLAPAVGTGTASMLTIIGTVAIPMPMLGVAGAVSVLTLFGGRQ